MGAPDAAAPEVWHIRGEGGDVIAFQLPLPEGIPSRLRSGALMRVNPDGSPYTAPPVPVDAPAASLAEYQAAQAEKAAPVAEEPLERPAGNARKAAWVAYAHSTGRITLAAAEDLSRDELVARFGGA